MAIWDRIGSRGRVEDRRGLGPVGVGGLGVGGVLLLLAINYLGGGSVIDVLPQIIGSAQPSQNYDAADFEGVDEYEAFAGAVLGSGNDMWSAAFAESGRAYEEPTLVLFRGATESGCGVADSRSGPHYCPLDETIYLDETFFDELTTRLGAEGGDVAEAYVIAHELGHHVQNELGALSGDRSNAESIETELQADCYAGLWAYSIRELGVLAPGEIEEAIDAAAAVGDDRIQTTVQGRVTPETWTHGSSAQRVAAFNRGYESGLVEECQK
jgi:predicted metalloprotease